MKKIRFLENRPKNVLRVSFGNLVGFSNAQKLFWVVFSEYLFLRVSNFIYSIQCDRTTRSGLALDYAIQLTCPKCSSSQLNYQIKLYTKIQSIFNATLLNYVPVDDGTILSLELCKVQRLPCSDCIIRK